MKAFVAKRKNTNSRDNDCIVIAASKKEAQSTFEEKVEDFGYLYLKKDFLEVNLLELNFWSINLIPRLEGEYSFNECIEFDIHLKTDYEFDNYIEKKNRLVSEGEKTTNALIKLAKEKYPNFFMQLTAIK